MLSAAHLRCRSPSVAGRSSRPYIGLADREGPDAVSLRRLGTELGADARPSIGTSRDKDALLEAVADRLLNDLADRHRSGGAWRTRSAGSVSRVGACT